MPKTCLFSRSLRGNALRFALVLAMSLALTLSLPSASLAKVFTVPPDITGDLTGTTGNDTIIINNGGTVTGDVDGGGGNNTITNNGTIGDDLYGNDHADGNVTITNSGSVGDDLFGNHYGDGNVTITNSGSVGFWLAGIRDGDGNVTIVNTATGKVERYLYGIRIGDGNVSITNQGTVGDTIIGLYQGTGYTRIVNSGRVVNDIWGSFSGIGDVLIINSGLVGRDLEGILSGITPAKGNATIYNSGRVGGNIYGSLDRVVGDVTIYNSGRVDGTLYGIYTSSGGKVTIVNSGTVGNSLCGLREGAVDEVIITNSGTVGATLFGSYIGTGNVTIYNSGMVTNNIYGLHSGTGNATIINTGTVGGNISALVSSTGNATITNAGTVNGSIEAGPGNDKVTLAGGSVVNGAVDGGAGTDALYLQGSGVVRAPGGGIVGFESVTMNGHSQAIYTGTWDFGALNLNVVSGTHIINGSVTAASTIITGGILGGSGTLYGNVTNSGTISPGNSIGTLTINGDYTQNAGSFYLCELNAKGQSDLIRVTGAADLQGGVLRGVLVRGLYSSGTRWTVLTADGGITGRFSGFQQATHSLTLSLAMTLSGDSVGLVVSRKPYAELAGSSNQLAVATTLDAILPSALARNDEGWASFMTMLDFDYDLTQMRAAFKALSPEMYDAFSGASLNQARTFGLLMADRSRAARAAARLGQPDGAKGSGPVGVAADELPAAAGMAGPAPSSGWSLWARTLGGWGYQARSGEVNGYRLSTAGVVLGADGPVLPWLRLGVAMAAISTDFSWNNEHHEGDQQAIMAGLYATAGLGGLHIDGSLSYGSYDNTATRAIIMDGISARAKSSFDGTSLLARLGGGYDFKAGSAVFGPMASLSYLRLEREGFREHGADFLSLKVREQTEDYWAGSLGLAAAWRWQREDFTFLPRLSASWQHNFNADRREISASFTDYGDHPFTVRGIAPTEDLLVLEAGLTTQFTDRLAAYLEYALCVGDGFHAHGFTAGVSWAF